MKNSLDVKLLEELSNLEYYIVKAPVSSKDFWKEWQEKFSRVSMARIATKKLIKSDKIDYEEMMRYRSNLSIYEEVLQYLDTLRRLALQVRGCYSQDFEFDDEDIDLDI